MKNVKNLIKAWEAVKAIKLNAKIREREFAVEMRKEFETGDVGDREFVRTVTDHLNEPAHVAQYLLALALAARAFPTTEDFDNRVGKAVKYLARLPTKEQHEVLTTAKKQTKTVQTVIREREIAAGLRAPSVRVVTPSRVANVLEGHLERLADMFNADELAELRTFVAQYKSSKAAV